MDLWGTMGNQIRQHIQSEIHALLHSQTHTYHKCVVSASDVYFMSVCVFNFVQINNKMINVKAVWNLLTILKQISLFFLWHLWNTLGILQF